MINPQDMDEDYFNGNAEYLKEEYDLKNLTKEDKEQIKKMPKSVFDFMGIPKNT